jgi:5-carboxymethyl-2-hydroxymuconate isomerase
MPHLILEAPKSVDMSVVKDFIDQAEKHLADRLPAGIENFKSRVYKYKYCAVANKNDQEMIHLEVKVMSGRTQELLKEIALELKALLVQLFSKSSENLVFTVEVSELSQAYAK